MVTNAADRRTILGPSYCPVGAVKSITQMTTGTAIAMIAISIIAAPRVDDAAFHNSIKKLAYGRAGCRPQLRM
jgi:hypothetical protein